MTRQAVIDAVTCAVLDDIVTERLPNWGAYSSDSAQRAFCRAVLLDPKSPWGYDLLFRVRHKFADVVDAARTFSDR